jgi:RNase adaptor protein for sRNA GlmZ degradation
MLNASTFRYPSSFIDTRFRQFFSDSASLSQLQPYVHDEQGCTLLRNKILGLVTTRQSQVATSASIADVNNDQLNEQDIRPTTTTTTMKSTTVVNERHENRLIVRYTHERRFEPMKRQMHQIYYATFRNTLVEDVKMVVGSRNQKDARNDLIRERLNRA